MAAVENVGWLNQNLLRTYPIREDSDITPYTSDGVKATGIRLPTCLITDFSFTLAFDDVNGTVPSLTGLTHASDGFSFEVSLGAEVLTTISVRISTHTLNKAYSLVGQGGNEDCGGWIVLGDLRKAAEELPEGVYRFTPGQAPFEVSTLRMAPRGVRSITAVGKYGLRTYRPLFGNIRIIAGSDMTVRNDSPNNAIWLQAESKTGYERTTPCDCVTSAVKRIRSINGMSVDAVQIIGSDPCVTVQTDENTITVKDTCSTPCCGCAELNFVESAVATINQSLSVLNSYAEALKERLTELTENKAVTQAIIDAYPKPSDT